MIQSIPEGVDSKFRLVLLIARRAEQLMRGARPKLETDRPLKPTRLAAAEFEEDQVRWGYGAEGGVLEVPGEEAERAGRARRGRGRPLSLRLRGAMNRPPRILLGVSRGHRRLQGGGGAPRAGHAGRRRARRHDPGRARVRRAADVLRRSRSTRCFTEVWGAGNAPAVEHVELAARAATSCVVAPATAHTLGQARQRARRRLPVDVVPRVPRPRPARAGDGVGHVGARRGAGQRRDCSRPRGAVIVGPDERVPRLGTRGRRPHGGARRRSPRRPGAWRPGSGADLRGLRLLVTAGPTREPIDPVRFVSNRSSGRMGFALAEAARDRGARVTLAGGPDGPGRARTASRPRRSRRPTSSTACSCASFRSATASSWPRPSATSSRRRARDACTAPTGRAQLRLAPGRDISRASRRLKRGQTVVAFAAETEDLEAERGRRKMEAEGRRLDRRQRRRASRASASTPTTTRS